jgi:hypothetical protein
VLKVPFVYSGAGIKCFDILKGSTSQALATCVPPWVFPINDTGSATTAYTPNTRNSTGDIAIDSSSTSGLILKAPNGTCYLVQVSNTPALTLTATACE